MVKNLVCCFFDLQCSSLNEPKEDYHNLDIVIDRIYITLFKTSNMTTVRDCQQYVTGTTAHSL